MSLSLCLISGQFSNPDGSPVAFGTLRLTLSQVGVVSGTSQIVPSVVSFTLNSSGLLSGLVVGNDQISPSGTVYYAKLYAQSGEFLADWQGLGFFINNSTFNFNTAVPVSGSNLIYPVAGPTGPIGPTGAASLGNVPFLDAQVFGAKPRIFFNSNATTTVAAGSSGTGLNLAAANGFVNGDGLAIPTAGAATALTSAPSAPTAVAKTVQGGLTLNYKVVAVDALCGLSPASSAGQVTNAPAIFGNLKIAISSISVTSDVCTVNFSSPINASANQTIHITGVTTLTAVNGVWTIASAPTTSQITFAIITANGTGVVTAAFGRISNVAIISSISRAANGVITITTAQNHGFTASSAGDWNPNIVNIEGVTPSDLCGERIILSASGTTITCASGMINAAETGTVVAGTSTATSFEYVYVTCPAYTTGVFAYYVYADGGTGTYALIGKTLPGEMGFKDFGQTYGGGYVAPAYVPTTPPSSAQNQIYAGIISSGGGTTSLVVSPTIPNPVTGQTVLHDDAICLATAFTAATIQSDSNYVVSLTPPESAIEFPQYVFNSPLIVPNYITLILGCALIVNETCSFGAGNRLISPLGSCGQQTPQFGIGNYAPVSGLASPLVLVTGDKFDAEWIRISVGGASNNTNNGQHGLVINSNKTRLENLFLSGGTSGTAIPLVYNGISPSSWHSIRDCQFSAASIWGNTLQAGQSCDGPPVGAIWIHSSDAAGAGAAIGNFQVTGNTSFNGRGILVDGKNTTSQTFNYLKFGDGTIEFQAPTTPSVMFWCEEAFNVTVDGWLNDSGTLGQIANWCPIELTNVELKNSNNSGTFPFVMGNVITRLRTLGNTSTSGNPILGQNVNLVSEVASTLATTGAGTTDSITIPGTNIYSTVTLTAMNAAAATMMLTAPGIFAACTANTVTLTHGSSLAGAIFSVQVSIN